MNWNRIDNGKYECITDNWHFIIETNPDGNNILTNTTHFKHIKNNTKIITIEDNVRECFYRAFDLNLMTERYKT